MRFIALSPMDFNAYVWEIKSPFYEWLEKKLKSMQAQPVWTEQEPDLIVSQDRQQRFSNYLIYPLAWAFETALNYLLDPESYFIFRVGSTFKAEPMHLEPEIAEAKAQDYIVNAILPLISRLTLIDYLKISLPEEYTAEIERITARLIEMELLKNEEPIDKFSFPILFNSIIELNKVLDEFFFNKWLTHMNSREVDPIHEIVKKNPIAFAPVTIRHYGGNKGLQDYLIHTPASVILENGDIVDVETDVKLTEEEPKKIESDIYIENAFFLPREKAEPVYGRVEYIPELSRRVLIMEKLKDNLVPVFSIFGSKEKEKFNLQSLMIPVRMRVTSGTIRSYEHLFSWEIPHYYSETGTLYEKELPWGITRFIMIDERKTELRKNKLKIGKLYELKQLRAYYEENSKILK